MTNIKEKVALLLTVAMLVTNPVTGQYVQIAMELAFNQLFLIGSYVSLVAGVYICGLIAWNMYASREKVNIPKHSKGKAGKYILTN